MTKDIHIWLPPEEYARLADRAVNEGRSIAQMARHLVRQALRAYPPAGSVAGVLAAQELNKS